MSMAKELHGRIKAKSPSFEHEPSPIEGPESFQDKGSVLWFSEDKTKRALLKQVNLG
jgi:hypothetical protein